jgi:DNA-directed RNA polymerase specialized sigma24 family protein
MLRSKATKNRLAACWKRVPLRERLMLTLVFFEGLTFTETARALGCSVREVESTIESRLERLSEALLSAARRPDREPRRQVA